MQMIPKIMFNLKSYFPILDWGKDYSKQTLASDFTAAIIVTIMLIPQSLAYAMLAGLPPEYGLYASILPLILYAIFGTSRTLAVGPVAVVSLMTAAAVSAIAEQGSLDYVQVAAALALMSGGILTLMGLLRMGFLANLLSHPVISGFITASGALIAFSQLKHILGIDASGHNVVEIISALAAGIPASNTPTIIIGLSTLALLIFVRKKLSALLKSMGLGAGLVSFLTKAGPVMAVIGATWATYSLGLAGAGVRIVGDVPSALPSFHLPVTTMTVLKDLLPAAFLISLIGFVESVSVAQTLAAKRRQRIEPNQELIALGAANLGSGISGGYPVTGGFARSVVNFDAGAATPAAGAFTAVGIAFAALYFTPYIYFLPKATLAATIIIAVLSLIDIPTIKETWNYSKRDFSAMALTIIATLGHSVEAGVASGVMLSILLHLYSSSKPHSAIVGLVAGTEHFRNILRHDVITHDKLLTLRVDESLYFANARFLEDMIYSLIAGNDTLEHLVLMCPAVNGIDASALESLEAINHRLDTAGIKFHLSEVKGPVMDRLKRSHLLDQLTGKVYLSQYQAYVELSE